MIGPARGERFLARAGRDELGEERGTQNEEPGHPGVRLVEPGAPVPDQQGEDEQGRAPEREVVLPEALEEDRRNHGDEPAAEGSTSRNQQIEGRELTGARPHPHELAVADHADREEHEGVRTDLHRQVQDWTQGDDYAAGDERDPERRVPPSPGIPARTLEADHEGEQIET